MEKLCESSTVLLVFTLFVHMASGTLDDKEFYKYVANYTQLLNNFLEVYKLAADQCEDDCDKAAFLGWSKNVKQEVERHNSIVEQKLGFYPTRETTLHTATAKYKEFLLATASGDIQGHELPTHQSKIPAYTLGAMTPSLRLYAFLSRAVWELVTSDDTSRPRSKWIKKYSYENFKTSYLHAEVLLDKLCNSLAQAEIEVVERLHHHALRLEMDFFFSRQSEQTLIIPIHTKLDPKEERLMLFVDFETCTDLGSLGILKEFAIMTAQKADQLLQGQNRDKPSHITSTELKNAWELLSQQSTFESMNYFEKVNNLDAFVNAMSCWSGDLTRSDHSGAPYSSAFWVIVVTLATIVLPCQQIGNQARKRMLEAGVGLEREHKKQKVHKGSTFEPFIRCLACRKGFWHGTCQL